MIFKFSTLTLLFLLGFANCKSQKDNPNTTMENSSDTSIQVATLGAGCFWCVEAIYAGLKGVVDVTPGYSGGHTKNPTYKEVCSDTTGHAEVCQIKYNSDSISFKELLEVFFAIHDPTTLNRQGNDVGTQYRSAIFYHTPEQKTIAGTLIKKMNESGEYDAPIVTEVKPFEVFYKAEDYHNNYFENNPNQPYCQLVISPKVQKFRKAFKDLLK